MGNRGTIEESVDGLLRHIYLAGAAQMLELGLQA